MDESKFDAVALAWGGGSVDNDPKQIWHSASIGKGGSNFIGYSNKEVDKLIDKAREELDKQKRIPLYQEIYRKIAEDAPYAFLFNDKFVLYAINSRIQQPKDTFKFAIGREYFSVKSAAE
jgi:peptide/nickel transport system substrate-binding protein/microcin C transport system substrate-binding protein